MIQPMSNLNNIEDIQQVINLENYVDLLLTEASQNNYCSDSVIHATNWLANRIQAHQEAESQDDQTDTIYAN